MQKRAGLPIGRFIAATNANDIVPAYLQTGRFEPRASVHTLANAMDVGNPSNFDRVMWLYGGSVDRVRADITGSRHDDGEVRDTIRRVWQEHGYLLDPHSAIAYLGITAHEERQRRDGAPGIFLATAHPAKFSEVVEPIIGERILKPARLLAALACEPQIVHLDATLDALRDVVSRG
jgi:threonine synthase